MIGADRPGSPVTWNVSACGRGKAARVTVKGEPDADMMALIQQMCCEKKTKLTLIIQIINVPDMCRFGGLL